MSGVSTSSVRRFARWPFPFLMDLLLACVLQAEMQTVPVEGQPLGANVRRLVQAMEFLGVPLEDPLATSLLESARARDAKRLQTLLDPQVLVHVHINPELRVKAARGEGPARLQEGGHTPVIVKVVNEGAVNRPLHIDSPQAGAVYAGASEAILARQAQTELNARENIDEDPDRFLDLSIYSAPPMTPKLSGLAVEYVLALLYTSEAGKREAILRFDVGQGTQDLGFRAEVPVLFDARPAIPVELSILDSNGRPTAARLLFRDGLGRVYPLQAKRLAPDFFFQPQIYRHDGESVRLPPGELTLTYSRGPEYRVLTKSITVPAEGPASLSLQLERWVDPDEHGFYSGDHHIHGAGCSHYTSPTEGVLPEHMFAQVKGEGLNVGCVLTWGPCFDYQRQFFAPQAHLLSEPFTVLKYDLEISGFGSAALGHVCLLNLTDQTYPGSEGTKERGWPTWTVPVMRWCKEQGGFTGYPHSAMDVDAKAGAADLLTAHDADADALLGSDEVKDALLAETFVEIDADGDGGLSEAEVRASFDRAADRLPNLAPPAMDGRGAMEIFVSVPESVCDFVSAMDTRRVPEWNTWYHLMNCGFPLKLSGETDFPCMSSRQVGQGRVYVQLGEVPRIDFSEWARGLAEGRSYVSDGYAHALVFAVAGVTPGISDVVLEKADSVAVEAAVAFAPQIPEAVAHGTIMPAAGRRVVGDTVNLHAPRSETLVEKEKHLVELVVNGQVQASREVPGDGQVHRLEFDLAVSESSWIALRSFPQLHTNPVNVLIDGAPIRASRDSARWCHDAVERLWKNRSRFISEDERPEAMAAYERAKARYLQIASECRH